MNNAVLTDKALINYSALLCDKKKAFIVYKQTIINGYCPAVYLISKPIKSYRTAFILNINLL